MGHLCFPINFCYEQVIIHVLVHAIDFKFFKSFKPTVSQLILTICFAGNKIDQINRREIPSHIGEQFAKRYEMKFIETSAKEAENVDALFYDIATQLTKQAHQQALETDKGVNFKAHNTSTISSCSTCLRF